LDDGVITHEESADLRIVGDILDISQEFVTPGLAAPVIERDEHQVLRCSRWHLAGGEKVVFAGDMSRDREDIETDLSAVANSLADLLRISTPRNNQPLSSERLL
jgi:DNA polymerase-3 subunit epsilon